jgi:Flp pilus assembly protein TadD
MVGKDFVLVNYSGGVNFYIGNNPESDGISAVLPGYGNDWDEYSIAEMRTSRALKPSEVSRYWATQGFDFMRSHTGQFIRLFIKKSFLLWNGKEISNNQNIYRFVQQSLLLRSLLFFYGSSRWYFAFPSSLILSLAISGIILNGKRKTAVLLPLLCVLAFGFSVALFFVASRYRMVFIAFLIPFSAASVFWLISHLRRKREVFLWILSFIPFLIMTNIDPYSVSMENNALESYNLGNAYLQQGKLDKAKEFYRKGIKANDHFPRLHLNLGTIYFKENNIEQAEEEYLIEISINPQDARAYHNLSLVCERRGKIEDAIMYERKAVEKMVRYTVALGNLGRLYVKVEHYDSALVFLQKAYRLEKKDGKIISLLGLSNLKLGYYEEAISIYEKAVQLNDEEPFVHYNLAIAFIAAGNLSEARMHLLRAVTIKHDFAEAHYNLGLVYLREGKTDKAADHLREAVRIQPNLQEAKKMIENRK